MNRLMDKVEYTQEEQAIVRQMLTICEISREYLDTTHPDLPLEKIAQICSDVLGCPTSVFTEKTNHKDYANKFQKELFFYAAYYFSNKTKDEILQYSAFKARDLFDRIASVMYYNLKSQRKKGEQILRLLKTLMVEVPNRLHNIISIDVLNLSHSDTSLTIKNTLAELNDYDLKESIKPGCIIQAYSPDGNFIGRVTYDNLPTGNTYYGHDKYGQTRAIICALQGFGYRFIFIPKPFSFDDLKNKLQFKPHSKTLNQYQVSRIPIRSLEWMANNNIERFLTIYRVGDPSFCGTFHKQWQQDREPLLRSQEEGYRYLDQSPHKDDESEEHFKLFNPICDKCVNKSSCESKNKKASEKENCYKPVSLDPLRVPTELLEEFLIHQLQ